MSKNKILIVDDEVDKILGLASGGDDYVTKPFSPKFVIDVHIMRAIIYTALALIATSLARMGFKKHQVMG